LRQKETSLHYSVGNQVQKMLQQNLHGRRHKADTDPRFPVGEKPFSESEYENDTHIYLPIHGLGQC
jgi:hypothetical protein